MAAKESAAAKGTTTNRQDETIDRNDTGNPNDTSYRPVLDQDIINDNVGPTSTGTGEVMPIESGMRNPVMPNSDDVTNPVMPTNSNVSNPVMTNEGKVHNPVMPDESGVSNPVMPPERDTTTN